MKSYISPSVVAIEMSTDSILNNASLGYTGSQFADKNKPALSRRRGGQDFYIEEEFDENFEEPSE